MKNNPAKVYRFQKIGNFRELGGYPTDNGHTVRFGRLFRSGHLANVNSLDHKKLKDLGIQTIIDLRTREEAQRQPDHLPVDAGLRAFHFPVNEENYQKTFFAYQSKITHPADLTIIKELMVDLYRDFASKWTNSFKDFMHTLLENRDQPILWHCTAGKDRTGFASALILKILGVPEEMIIQDYYLSKIYMDKIKRKFLFLQFFQGKGKVKIYEEMMGVHGSWLQMPFQVINEQWGGFDQYIHEGLQLNSAQVQMLKDAFLVE